MKFLFQKIDIAGFIRIWDSDFRDAHADSHSKSFHDTDQDQWMPLYEKHLRVMHEVVLDEKIIGYIFLSPKDDGSAHLGYGLYHKFRGKGFSTKMCRQYMQEKIPLLPNTIDRILATTLKDNIASQRVLAKLGFIFKEKLNDPDYDYLRYEQKLIDIDFN